MEVQRQALIIGADSIGKELISALPDLWSITVIDKSEEKLSSFDKISNVRIVQGDACGCNGVDAYLYKHNTRVTTEHEENRVEGCVSK